MQAVDVLRPLALGKLGLRPRELEVLREVAVERGLRRCHDGSSTDPARVLRQRNALDLPAAHRCRLERHLERRRARGAPRASRRPRRARAAPSPRRSSRADRRTGARLLLHLDDEQRPPAAQDEVELIAADARVRRRAAGTRAVGSGEGRGARRGSRRLGRVAAAWNERRWSSDGPNARTASSARA